MRFRPADLVLYCGAMLMALAVGCSVAPASIDNKEADTSRLPRVNEVRAIFVSPATTIYLARESIDKAGPLIAAQLTQAGWQRYSSPLSSDDHPDDRIASFKRGSQAVSVFLTVEPGRERQTSVQYAAVKLAHDLPFPIDGEEIKFDPNRPLLRCTTRQPQEKLVAFFDTELAARGWSVPASELAASRKDGTGVLAHYKSDEKPSLELRLKRREDGCCDVVLEGVAEEDPKAASTPSSGRD